MRHPVNISDCGHICEHRTLWCCSCYWPRYLQMYRLEYGHDSATDDRVKFWLGYCPVCLYRDKFASK